MKSKTRKLRDKAIRLGQSDPTLTAGLSREEMNSFYKRGGKTPTKQERINKQLRKSKKKLKQSY